MKQAYRMEADVARAVETMRNGGVILYPTDTIWGLGCDATNSEAVKKIYNIKRRENSKSMISLVDSAETLIDWVEGMTVDEVKKITGEFEGPVTVIYPDPMGLATELLAEDGSAGLRITDELFSNALCKALGKPIVSTSANISGDPSPGNFSEIKTEVIEAVDYVVRYGRDDKSLKSPSRIIRIKNGKETEIIR